MNSYSLKSSAEIEFTLFSRYEYNLRNSFSTVYLNNTTFNLKTCSEYTFDDEYQVIIDFTGCGDLKKLSSMQDKIIIINDQHENLILKYLINHPETTYISSGAAHLSDFSEPILRGRKMKNTLCQLANYDSYSVAKYLSKIRHHTLKHRKIIDLRILSYIPKNSISTEDSLIGEINFCLKNNKNLIIDGKNIEIELY